MPVRRPFCLAAFAVAAVLVPAGTVPARGQAVPASPAPVRSAPVQPAPAGPSLFADADAVALAQRGLDAANDLRFDEAVALAAQLEQRYPGHPAPAFLRALPTWWRILLDLTNGGYDAPFDRAMDEVVRRAEVRLHRNGDDFDGRFFRGAALGFQGRMAGNRSRWFDAARKGRAAMNDVFFVARKDPSNPDFGFGRGLYDYYATVIPERYPVARPVLTFFPDADRARGLAALERAAAEGTFLRTEATYFLAQIYYLYEEDYDRTMGHVRTLRARHPANPFFLALEGRVEARWGRWDAATAAFQAVLAAYRPDRPEFTGLAEQALYYLARSAMREGRNDDALLLLLRLDASTGRFRKGDSYYRVLGRLRQGMAYEALGRRDEAVLRYRQVLAMQDYADAHDQARRRLGALGAG